MKKSEHKEKPHIFWMIAGAIIVLYLLTHLARLAHFPVFADEAIYIRWSQLFIDDWKQYLFFPLNDGKTPLFIWMMAAAQFFITDQLAAGRFVSVIAGIVQMIVMVLVLRELGARKLGQLLGMLLVCVLPFWFTYHYLALMDGLLTVWLSLTFLLGLKSINSKKHQWLWAIGSGITFGLGLWTKLPALFYLPIFGVIPLFAQPSIFQKIKGKKSQFFSQLILAWLPQAIAAGIGIAIFASLKISPAFGQLFSRGQDFTFTFQEVLAGKWTEIFPNAWRFLQYYAQYLTVPLLIVIFAGLFSNKARSKVALLFLSALLFLAPFLILGKVVYPRYLLPSVFFLTAAAVLSLESLLTRCQQELQKNILWAGVALVIAVLAGQTLTYSTYFISNFLYNPDQTPFVYLDRVQYLEEWSSGHGIRETVEYIQDQMKDHSVAVATEGRFGTLPDGLLLLFHRRDVRNLYIEGIEQYPVKSLPDFFVDRAQNFDQSILVVNSHRMELKLPRHRLIAEYCRPNKAPCLQVWDITEEVKPAQQIPMRVLIFMKLNTSEEVMQKMAADLKKKSFVTQLNIVTQEEALEFYRKYNEDDPLLLELVTADILPASIELTVSEEKYARELRRELQSSPEVDEVALTMYP